MSALALLTGHDREAEGEPVTLPYARSGDRPFWTGIPGLDPSCPAPSDPELAARIAAEACAVHVHGMTAVMARIMARSPAQKYLDWLLKAGDDTYEAWVRRYALRVTCDRAGASDSTDPGDILDAANSVVAFVYPGRRR